MNILIFSEKYFYGWHNECLIEKLRRKRDLKICAEYFRIWKNECLGENRAVKMVGLNNLHIYSIPEIKFFCNFFI